MSAYTTRDELRFIPANRISHPEHHTTARASRPSLLDRARAWYRKQTVLNELNDLSDRELADIGLARATIRTVFDPAFAPGRYR